MSPKRMVRIALAVISACFLLFGVRFLPLPGLHYDEILFLHPFLYDWALSKIDIDITTIPIMVMSYVGALKTWLYWPIYTFLPPSVWAIRLPMLLLGTVNVLLVYRLGARLWSPGAGIVAAAIAATNPTFLLAQVFDWGPVTLQITLTLLAGLAVVNFRDSGKTSSLFVLALCLGLALWNKAIFLWFLAGIPIALLVCWPRTPWLLSPRRIALVLLGFVLGSLPLLYYNFSNAGNTLSQNTKLESSFPLLKLKVVRGALDGDVIASNVSFFPIWDGVCLDSGFRESLPDRPLSAGLQRLPESTMLSLVFLAALVWLAIAGHQPSLRSAWFLVILFAVSTGLAMATVGAGTGVHHYAPQLPLVFLIIGAAWHSAAARFHQRPARAGLVTLAVIFPVFSALVLAGWHSRAQDCGSRGIWSDASPALVQALSARPSARYLVLDWGIDPQLIYLSAKRARILRTDCFNGSADQTAQDAYLREILASDEPLFLLDFVPSQRIFASRWEDFAAAVQRADARLDRQQLISDRLGRPVYQLWRVTGSANSANQP